MPPRPADDPLPARYHGYHKADITDKDPPFGGVSGTDNRLVAPSRSSEPGARGRVIEEHLPLVESVARRYVASGEPVEDLVQAGAIGLIKAVDRFEPSRGLALSTLAVPAIEGEIRHHLRDR